LFGLNDYVNQIVIMFFSLKKTSKHWTENEIQELFRRFRAGDTVDGLSRYFSRSRSDVQSQLEDLFRKMLQTQELYLVARKLDVPSLWIRMLFIDKK